MVCFFWMWSISQMDSCEKCCVSIWWCYRESIWFHGLCLKINDSLDSFLISYYWEVGLVGESRSLKRCYVKIYQVLASYLPLSVSWLLWGEQSGSFILSYNDFLPHSSPEPKKKNLIDSVLKALKPSVKENSPSCKLFLSGNLSLWQSCDWYTFWPVEYEIEGTIWLARNRNKLHVKKCTISKVLPFETTVSAGTINNTVHRWTCKCRGIEANPPK